MEANKTSEYNFDVLADTKMQRRTSRNIYLIKFKTFQATGNPVNTTKVGLDAGRLENFQVRFYLNDPLCIMAI